MMPAGRLFRICGASAGVAQSHEVVAKLGAKADRTDMVMILASAGLVAEAGIEREEFAVVGVATPDAVSAGATTGRTAGVGRERFEKWRVQLQRAEF